MEVQNMKLSIIIPAYNEEENVNLIYKSISSLFENINYEILFINDGSSDKTDKVLENLYKHDEEHVRAINFSRNFGKEAAIYAGLEHSIGEYTAIIDSDMEQNPKYLLQMLTFLDSHAEYDQVAMVIKERKAGSKIKRFMAKNFYKLMNKLSDTKFEEGASDFRMFRSNVRDAILKLQERNRFSKGIFSWIGFNTKYMEYDVGKRAKGESKFTFRKSIRYALDGIVGYSVKPLKIATVSGTLCSFIGFIYLIYVIIKTLILGADTPGFATIVCLVLFIGGIQLICLGILGEYISKTFIETKSRPIYVEKSKLGFDEEIL